MKLGFPVDRLRRFALRLTVATFFGCVATPALADWPPLGVRLCEVPGPQTTPVATTDGFGGAFVCWEDQRGALIDGDPDKDLYLQRVTFDGQIAPNWPHDGVEISTAPNNQYYLDLAPDGIGGCYLLWEDQSAGSDIYLTRITSEGQRSAGWPAPGLKVGYSLGWPVPNLIPDAAGTYVVFDSQRGGTSHVYVQRVTGGGQIAAGWPDQWRRIGNHSGWQAYGQGVSDGAGGLIVTWAELSGDNTSDLFAIRVLPDGSTSSSWPENGIPFCTAPGYQTFPVAVEDGSGGAFVAWDDVRTAPIGIQIDVPYKDVYAHRILANATVDPSWPVDGLAVCALPQTQSIRDVCSDGQGGMYVNWGDYRTNVSDIYVQRIGGDGTLPPGWPQDGRYAGGDPGYDGALAPLAPDGNGGVYVAWQTEAGQRHVLTQHLTANGQNAPGWQAAGNPLVVHSGGSLTPWLAADGHGGAIVAWADTRICSTCEKVFALRIGGSGPTAVTLSLVEASAAPGVAHLVWRLAGGGVASEFALERSAGNAIFSAIALLQPDGQGGLTYDDHVDQPGRYQYRLRYKDDGQTRFSPLAEIEIPSTFVLALAGFTPNPAVAASPLVSFSLPRQAPGALTLYDVAGRVVSNHDLSSLSAGRHTLHLAGRGSLGSGIYWIRLIHDGRQLIMRGAIVQ